MAALACFMSSFLLQIWTPRAICISTCGAGVKLGHAKPDQVVSMGGGSRGVRVVPDPRPGASPGAVDVPQLSDKLDASTVRIEDRYLAIHSDVSAARLELPSSPGRARAGLSEPSGRASVAQRANRAFGRCP